MKAGQTDFDIDTEIIITGVADKEDQNYVGLKGKITNAFPGHMVGSPDKYIAGVRLDVQEASKRGIGPDRFGNHHINLIRGDTFEAVED